MTKRKAHGQRQGAKAKRTKKTNDDVRVGDVLDLKGRGPHKVTKVNKNGTLQMVPRGGTTVKGIGPEQTQRPKLRVNDALLLPLSFLSPRRCPAPSQGGDKVMALPKDKATRHRAFITDIKKGGTYSVVFQIDGRRQVSYTCMFRFPNHRSSSSQWLASAGPPVRRPLFAHHSTTNGVHASIEAAHDSVCLSARFCTDAGSS